MYERFTDRSLRVTADLAPDEAKLLDEHDRVGTEHLLLGLLREGEGIAAQALATFDVSLDAIRQYVKDYSSPDSVTTGRLIPFTVRAREVMKLALREALALGHTYIDTEHLLLGIIRLGDGTAVKVLLAVGVDLAQLREKVFELIDAVPNESPETVEIPQPEPFVVDVGGVDEELIRLRNELGENHPDYLLALADSCERWAQRFRDQAQKALQG